MTRLLVVDDHPIVTAGIKEFLFDYEEITVAGEAGSGMEAVRDDSFPHKIWSRPVESLAAGKAAKCSSTALSS